MSTFELCFNCNAPFNSTHFGPSHQKLHENSNNFPNGNNNNAAVTKSKSHGRSSSSSGNEKTVPCTECGKMFSSIQRVRIHCKNTHGEKPCSCEICGNEFSYRCKLVNHMRIHTGLFCSNHFKHTFNCFVFRPTTLYL